MAYAGSSETALNWEKTGYFILLTQGLPCWLGDGNDALWRRQDLAVIWLAECVDEKEDKQGFKVSVLWLLTGSALMKLSSRLELDIELCRSVIAEPHTTVEIKISLKGCYQTT